MPSKGPSFSEVTWPTRKNEAFHYTPLSELAKTEWRREDIDLGALDEILTPYIETNEYRIVFGNGVLIEERTSLPPGLALERSPDCCAGEVGCNSSWTKPNAKEGEDFLLSLNCRFAHKKWLLSIDDGAVLSSIKVIFATLGDGVRAHPHLKIEVGEKAHIKLMELHVGSGAYLSNPALLVECRKNAECVYAKVQHESREAVHLGVMRGRVAEGGVLDGFMWAIGAKLARHDVRVRLNGERAHVEVDGLQSVFGPYVADLTSVIEHCAPRCTSQQNVKTVLRDKGHGVFQGKVFIERDAQKSDGYQMNQALFLDDTGMMDAKPELEIYADDVKCSHGATVGALDEEKLFYLRARGLSEKEARKMLTEAFIAEAFETVPNQELRNWVKSFSRFIAE